MINLTLEKEKLSKNMENLFPKTWEKVFKEI